MQSDGKESERAAGTYFRRMAAAERCPIRGPCDECASLRDHYCRLGERLVRGEDPEVAFEDALVEITFDLKGQALAFETPFAHRLLLSRLCRAHRRLAESILEARLGGGRRPAQEAGADPSPAGDPKNADSRKGRGRTDRASS